MSNIIEADFPFYVPDSLYDIYKEKIEKRIRDLIENNKLDAWEVILYGRGECSYEDVYYVAKREACKELEKEIEDGEI